jgi:hypothetical protein
MRGRASSQLFWRASAPTPKTHPESLPTKVRPCLFRGHRDRHRLDGAPVESVSALPRARGFTGTRMEFADPRQALPRARGFTERVGGRSLKALSRARGCTNGKRSGERRQSGLPRARGLTLSEGQHGGLASGSPTRARGFTDRHGRGRAGLWGSPTSAWVHPSPLACRTANGRLSHVRAGSPIAAVNGWTITGARVSRQLGRSHVHHDIGREHGWFGRGHMGNQLS